MNLKFETISIKDESQIFTTDYFLLKNNDECISYAKVRYIKSQDAEKINDLEGFYCYIINYDNKIMSDLFESDKVSFLNKYLKGNDTKQYLSNLNNFESRKEQFIKHWVDKPSIEIIRVKNEDTIEMPHINGVRVEFLKIADEEKKSYRGKDISYRMYNYIYQYYKEQNLKIWKSNKTNLITDYIWNKANFGTQDDRKFLNKEFLIDKSITLQKFT